MNIIAQGGGSGGRMRGFHHESDILRTPHEGEPRGPPLQPLGKISTFPSQSSGGQRLPPFVGSHPEESRLIKQLKEMCVYSRRHKLYVCNFIIFFYYLFSNSGCEAGL